MRTRLGLAFGAIAALAVIAAAPAAAQTTNGIQVTVDQPRMTAVIGDRITIRAHVTNSGSTASDPLIAHLNVASLTGTYVDLEDWTAAPTQHVNPLDAHATTALSWDIQAVNAGRFDVYVVMLPNGPTSSGIGPAVASSPVEVTVAGKRTLNAGGSLPVVIAVPLLLGGAALAARLRLRAASGSADALRRSRRNH
jgi:hypothetical protein